jgi:pyruvate,water dikinase
MFVRSFRQIAKKDVGIAGGKGASLGEMTKFGFPVPQGFVVLAPAFDRFLEEADLMVEIDAALHEVNHNDVNSVEEASEKIRDLIRDYEFPEDLGEEILREFSALDSKLVSVRSSATAEDSSIASWAGELESYLNVRKENLLESVKKCWSSLFTPRAIFYRYEKNMQDRKVSVAVVVQEMIQPEVSGVCFTVHPVTQDRDQMVIEAGYGLGEAIVGGKITPDTYVVNKSGKTIAEKNISEQTVMIVKSEDGTKEAKVAKSKEGEQKLTDAQILKVAELCRKIEEHYGYPQDIEWALKGGKIYILQSRPVTTL